MFRKKRKLRKYRYKYRKSTRFIKESATTKHTRKLLKSPSRINKFKKPLLFIIFTIAFILVLYSLFFSKAFTIQNIEIENNEDTKTIGEEMKEQISFAMGENLFFIDTEDLESAILSQFPAIQEISVTKNYPRTVSIEFSEHPLTANVVHNSPTVKKSYVINSIGYIIKEDLENTSLPYIVMSSDEPASLDQPLIESSNLSYILDSISYFEEKFGMGIKEVNYKKVAREIHLTTQKDFNIWLDTQRPIEEQFTKLKKALVKLDIYNESLEYIDLRIAGANGDRIIYKRKSE